VAGAWVVASATGSAEPGKAAANLTYLGRAERAVDNTGGADRAKNAPAAAARTKMKITPSRTYGQIRFFFVDRLLGGNVVKAGSILSSPILIPYAGCVFSG